MCKDETFGKKVKKLEKRLSDIDRNKGKKKKFMTPYKREVYEVDSN